MIRILSKDILLKWYDIFFPILLISVFFSLPLLFLPDTTVYLENAEFFAGEGASYSAYRGPVVPVLIMLMGKLFSYTVGGLKLGFFFVYLLFAVSVMAILLLLDIHKKIGRGGVWLLATFVLFFNVVLLTYSHSVLTEFFVITLTACYLALMLCMGRVKNGVIKQVLIALITAVALVLSYGIKQMFFPIILLSWAGFTVVELTRHFTLKRLAAQGVVLVLLGAMLLSYITTYATLTDGGNMEGDSVDSYAGSFLIDGLRYFEPVGSINYDGQPTTVNINDRFIEPITTFEYVFEPGLVGSLKYLFTCFVNAPDRFIASYVANYKIVSGVIVCEVVGITRKHTYATETIVFNSLYESGIWVEFFKGNTTGLLGAYPDGIGTALSQASFSHQVVQFGLASNLLFNTHYADLSIMFHTVINFLAPLILLLSVALLIASKKYTFINKKLCIINIFISSNVFLYIFFLAVTAQNIERYGIPMILFNGLFWIINSAYLASFIFLSAKKQYAKFGENRSV